MFKREKERKIDLEKEKRDKLFKKKLEIKFFKRKRKRDYCLRKSKRLSNQLKCMEEIGDIPRRKRLYVFYRNRREDKLKSKRG